MESSVIRILTGFNVLAPSGSFFLELAGFLLFFRLIGQFVCGYIHLVTPVCGRAII
jgi:hypothetical protein